MSTSHCTARPRRVLAGVTAALAVAGVTGLLSTPASAAPAPTGGPSNRSSAIASHSLDQAQRLATASGVPDGAATVAPGTSGRYPRVTTKTGAASATVLGSRLVRGQQLNPGDSLRSPNGRWSVVMGSDGILSYQQAPNRFSAVPVARSLLGQTDVTPVPGSFVALQGDGNMVLYGPDGTVLVNFDTVGLGEALQVQDDGNVVLYGAAAKVVLNFGLDARPDLLPGEVLLPGDAMRSLDGGTLMYMQGDGNLVVYVDGRPVWYTGTHSPGAAAVLQGDGNFVVYSESPSRPLFSTVTQTATGGLDTELDLLPGGYEVLRVDPGSGAVGAVYGSLWQTDSVLSGQALLPGDRRTSLDGRCTLVLQLDGNLVDYCAGVPVFSTGTSASSDGQVFGAMGENGNFVLFRPTADGEGLQVVFQTRTGRYPGSRLTVQGDANVVVYTPAGRAVYYTRR